MKKDANQKLKEAEDSAFIFLVVVTVIATSALFFALVVLMFQ
jgi:flagellar basal body-associated protein FliL